MGPVLRGRPGLEPREGQAAARILRGERTVIRGVSVQGGRLDRGREAGRCRVNLRWRAENPEGGESTFIPQEEVKWGETGLDGQNISGGAEEAVGCPPLDLVPEDGDLPHHVGRWHKHVRAIAEDGEQER